MGSEGCSITTVARPASRDELCERRAAQRKAERLAHGGLHVVERLARGGRAEDHVVVARLGDHDPRVGEEGNARHVVAIRLRGGPPLP